MHRSLQDYGFRGAGSLMSLELSMPQIEPEISEGIELPTRPQHPVEQKQKFLDAVVSRLTSAKVGTDKLRQKRGELLGKVYDGEVNLSEVDAFLELCEDVEHHALFEQHEEIRAAGRVQQAIVEQLGIKFGEALRWWNELREERDKAHFAQTVALTSKEKLSQFASNAQLKSAARRVAESRTNFVAASERFGAQQATLNSVGSELEEAKTKLQRISIEEAQARSMVLGESFYDAETGLESQPIVAVSGTQIEGVVK